MNPKKQHPELTQEFVASWLQKYDKKNAGKRDALQEQEVREWLARLPEPKYLDMENFLTVAKWKSPRPSRYYERNSALMVEGLTRLAYLESDPENKVRILTTLRGVSVPVAGTILHFLYPDRFAIFDVRCRTTLERAGLWKRNTKDASVQAWLEYVDIMRSLAQQLGVTLRGLDKALYMYDAEGAKNQ